jgi:serine/threonine-protein kinase RsbW
MLVNKEVIQSDLEEARQLEERLLEEVQAQGFSEAECFAIKLALEEGLINAIKHGNRYDPNKTVTVCYEIVPQKVSFAIADEGPGFSACNVPDPTADENLERPCGRGIMLIRAYMDEVSYNEEGNELRMVKRRITQG